MTKFKYENSEVIYFSNSPVILSSKDLMNLKKKASLNSSKKIRICSHLDKKDNLHEMFIVHHKDAYVRPHRHIGKSESMYIIEGEVDLILFHDNGSIRDVVEMGDFLSKKIIYHRLNQPIFHTLFIKSEYLVFHEVTEGPFDRSRTEFPDWAPINESTNIKHFIKNSKKNYR